jgi:hypothetical protein
LITPVSNERTAGKSGSQDCDWGRPDSMDCGVELCSQVNINLELLNSSLRTVACEREFLRRAWSAAFLTGDYLMGQRRETRVDCRH